MRFRELESVKAAFAGPRTKNVSVEKVDRTARIAEHAAKRAADKAEKIAQRAATFVPTSLEVALLNIGTEPWKIARRSLGEGDGTMTAAQRLQERVEDLVHYRDAHGITARPMKLPAPRA